MKRILLSESEINYILDNRNKERQGKKFTRKFCKSLKVASEYQMWLFKKKRGTSYSAFVNEFGYQQIDSKEMYSQIERIMNWRIAANG